MTGSNINMALRDEILARPDVLLEDKAVMRALVAAHDKTMGGNIVDLRGIAMERLEHRLDRLEETHRTVIAAAYENLAGTNQVHRAILRLLDANRFDIFLSDLAGDVADILRVDFIRLVLESVSEKDAVLEKLGDVLTVTPPGFIDDYCESGRRGPPRPVVLRQVETADRTIYGPDDWLRSEACLRLDFGEGRLPGMLVMGSEDPHLFSPNQGTDLLEFFGGIFERTMRRWLS
ncbi:MAG: DUF484 family protein [Pseudomonadota bacterium]